MFLSTPFVFCKWWLFSPRRCYFPQKRKIRDRIIGIIVGNWQLLCFLDSTKNMRDMSSRSCFFGFEKMSGPKMWLRRMAIFQWKECRHRFREVFFDNHCLSGVACGSSVVERGKRGREVGYQFTSLSSTAHSGRLFSTTRCQVESYWWRRSKSRNGIAVISRFKFAVRSGPTMLVHYLPHLSTWIVDVFWNGRNLFYGSNHQSAFWCFLALHSLTSWSLEISTEHSYHSIYSMYIYIYIYTSSNLSEWTAFLPLNFMITRTMTRQFRALLDP